MTYLCKRISKSLFFRCLIVLLVIASAILVGLETYPGLMMAHGDTFHLLNRLILGVFVIELAIRIVARGKRPWLFFAAPWNTFDFVIIAVCLLPINAEYFVVVRLFRILRILRLVTIFPRLQILVGALLNSLSSIGYIAILLFIQSYVYAIFGVMLFGGNDPIHFGTISHAMLSLFEAITLEGWVTILDIQMYGSNHYSTELFTNVATQPIAQPVTAALYFVSFILLGTMIVLNLFVGVIVSAIEEQTERVDLERLLKRKGSNTLSIQDQVSLLSLQAEELKESLNQLGQRLHHDIDPFRALALKRRRKPAK